MTTDHSSERGAALLLALMLVVVFGVLTATMTQGTIRLTSGAVDDRAALLALHAAEGGLEQARWRLQQDPDFAGETVRIGDAEVTVEVTKQTGDAPAWIAHAIARSRPRGAAGLPVQRQIVAELRASPDRATGLPTIRSWTTRP